MTDTDFNKIKAAFLALCWHYTSDGWEMHYARRGGITIGVVLQNRRWSYRIEHQFCGLLVRGYSPSIGRCLRSLRCAIRREAEALAGMVGMGVCL